MSALHTIHTAAALAPVLARAGDGALLLIEDGVYLALKPLDGRRAYVLREDLAARGLKEDMLAEGMTAIGMQEFVALAVAHFPVVAWF
jgi:sulfur relay protein TusB/DsrH